MQAMPTWLWFYWACVTLTFAGMLLSLIERPRRNLGWQHHAKIWLAFGIIMLPWLQPPPHSITEIWTPALWGSFLAIQTVLSTYARKKREQQKARMSVDEPPFSELDHGR